MKRVLYLGDKFAEWSGNIIAPLALVYMAVFLYEIVARYVFGAPTKWAHETSAFVFGAQFMLAGAYCYWRGSMVNVGILYDRLRPRMRAIVDLFTLLMPFGICILMVWIGGDVFLVSLKNREVSQTVFAPPVFPVRAMIPISAFLLLLQVVVKFIRDAHLAITGKELR